jgi:hypothetical protein
MFLSRRKLSNTRIKLELNVSLELEKSLNIESKKELRRSLVKLLLLITMLLNILDNIFPNISLKNKLNMLLSNVKLRNINIFQSKDKLSIILNNLLKSN